MFGVTGATPASTAREPVWTVWAAVTELLTEVSRVYASTGLVTRLSRMVAGTILVLKGGLAIEFGLDFAMMVGPRPKKINEHK